MTYLDAKTEYEKVQPANATAEEQEAVAVATDPKAAKRARKSEVAADIPVDATPKEKKSKAKKAASPPKAATPVRPLSLRLSPPPSPPRLSLALARPTLLALHHLERTAADSLPPLFPSLPAVGLGELVGGGRVRVRVGGDPAAQEGRRRQEARQGLEEVSASAH